MRREFLFRRFKVEVVKIFAKVVGAAIVQNSGEDDFSIGLLLGAELFEALKLYSHRIGNIEEMKEGIRKGLDVEI